MQTTLSNIRQRLDCVAVFLTNLEGVSPKLVTCDDQMEKTFPQIQGRQVLFMLAGLSIGEEVFFGLTTLYLTSTRSDGKLLTVVSMKRMPNEDLMKMVNVFVVCINLHTTSFQAENFNLFHI